MPNCDIVGGQRPPYSEILGVTSDFRSTIRESATMEVRTMGDLKPGDVVRVSPLKGPWMIVESREDKSAVCFWFDKNDAYHRETFSSQSWSRRSPKPAAFPDSPVPTERPAFSRSRKIAFEYSYSISFETLSGASMNIVRRFGIALSFISLTVAVQPVFAQENMPVDLTGTWRWFAHEDWHERAAGPDPGRYWGIPLNDAARMRADAYAEDWIYTSALLQCRPRGPTIQPLGLDPSGIRRHAQRGRKNA